jgi:hypothetical protein
MSSYMPNKIGRLWKATPFASCETMKYFILLWFPLIICCSGNGPNQSQPPVLEKQAASPQRLPANKNKVIQVWVALCDNKYQGIVPVPAAIGNGQDPARNLYWGAAFGVKTWYQKQSGWKKVLTVSDTARHLLERCVFWNATQKTWLVADAWDGQFIKNCTDNFLKSAAGMVTDSVKVNGETVYCGGSANLLSYVGHDGLMDFKLTDAYRAANTEKRAAIILACYSRHYFTPHIKNSGAQPLLWSNGLMSPEAYTLDAAVNAWLAGSSDAVVLQKAAAAYHQYQRCGIKAAGRLLHAGW